MKRKQILTERETARINKRLDRFRPAAYTSQVGGRYMNGVPKCKLVAELVTNMEFWEESSELLEIPVGALAFLSCSALDVCPGDPGIDAHVDYPHHVFPKAPHISAQFVLSLDGTDEERAPLWVGEPTNIVTLAPGELLFFGGNTLHGVHPNKSDRRRTTLLWSMGPLWVRPMLPEVWSWVGGWSP